MKERRWTTYSSRSPLGRGTVHRCGRTPPFQRSVVVPSSGWSEGIPP